MGVRADHFSFGFLISISILSLLAMVTASTKGTFTPSDALRALNRSYYPHDFSWGAASAAYQPGASWLYVYPRGLLDLLLYIKDKYNSPRIYITENGVDQQDNSTSPLPLKEALNDTVRIEYYHGHLSYLLKAIKAGVKVEGYFAWSLLDNFEWASGYTSRFGIYYTDFKKDQKRIPKLSVEWLRKFLQY
ncbi:hypothetical protein C3L33_05808, partial [Rhododendron williamsianum]